jgi:hypothetical protein
MLPHGYELPAAALLLVGGLVACFAGYRMFRIVLGIYGFILGAMLASSVTGVSNTVGMIAAAIVGGIVGSLLLIFAYFVGIALVGAGLGALVAHLVWAQTQRGDPPALIIIAASVVGAVVAMVLQRYVIIVGTAFGGAWTMIVGAVAAFEARQIVRAPTATSDAWILYPMSPAPGQRWVPIAWVVLGVIGTAMQLGWTVGGRKRKRAAKPAKT